MDNKESKTVVKEKVQIYMIDRKKNPRHVMYIREKERK
jgi:hypothetical protein